MKDGSIQIFFSYKSQNVVLVRRLAERLKADGIFVWMDEYGISHKQQENFQKAINDAIDRSQWAVLFVDDLYAESPYCLIEVERLLRINPYKIIVLILKESKKFELLYPELYKKGIKDSYSDKTILSALFKEKVLAQLPEPINHDFPSGIDEWESQDALFKVDVTGWESNLSSQFLRLIAKESTKLTEGNRKDYTEFFNKINGIAVKLILDYEYYDGPLAKSLINRVAYVQEEGIKKVNYDEDDRKRLKEEVRLIENEVKNAYIRAIMTTDFYQGHLNVDEINMPDWECIGIHLYSTKYKGSEFSHRLFSFRIPELQTDKSIFRVYKLVLPHPLLSHVGELPVRIRFIFCFQDDLNAFFRAIPWCDHLVNSFEWVTEGLLENLKFE